MWKIWKSFPFFPEYKEFFLICGCLFFMSVHAGQERLGQKYDIWHKIHLVPEAVTVGVWLISHEVPIDSAFVNLIGFGFFLRRIKL